MESTEKRIDALWSERREKAVEYAGARAERASQHADAKRQLDEDKWSRNQKGSLETQARLSSLEERKRAELQREERNLRSEFQLKSNLEELKWNVSVKKSDPGHVRQGLTAVKAPIPSGGGA